MQLRRRRSIVILRGGLCHLHYRPLDDLDYICIRQAFKDMHSVASSRKNTEQDFPHTDTGEVMLGSVQRMGFLWSPL